MEKLTLEHLAPYLPYGLKAIDKLGTEQEVFCSNIDHALRHWKPILRPIRDLDKEIPWNFKGSNFGLTVKFSDKGFFKSKGDLGYVFSNITNGHFDMAGQLRYFTYLYAHHFDIFGLIDSGLAIDINTI